MANKLEIMYGSLMHDIGKIIYRSHDTEFSKGTHSFLGWEFLKSFDEFNIDGIRESVKYHHYKELNNANLLADSAAYITYIADNIASGIDRRETEEEGNGSLSFDRTVPLSSIFNLVNPTNDSIKVASFPFGTAESTKYPTYSHNIYTAGQYSSMKTDMEYHLRNSLKYGENYFNSVIQWTESMWQFIPSSTNKKEHVDISLFDHSKVTCAIATCIYDYLEEHHVVDYESELFRPYSKTKEFYGKDAFLLMSMDMSGIQDFIYNISGNKALKSLRSRSFYLEMMLEVIVDELLELLKLSRANLLYTGGGHAYLLLPNTNTCKSLIDSFEEQLKEWFIDMFSADLSIALAYTECSGNDLMNAEGTYRSIWRNVAQKLSDKKAKKFGAKELIKLNNTKSHGDRECKECLRSDLELSDGRCTICDSIINISNRLKDKDFFVLTTTNQKRNELAMPFSKSLGAYSKEEIEKILNSQTPVRIYSKNRPYVSEWMTTNIWMCDCENVHEEIIGNEKFVSYTKNKKGINRMGVVRADVDNLGLLFMQGIPEAYNSISRTVTLSRNLSMFFKYEIKNILAGTTASVIYSGGDDLFIIGNWSDIIIATIDIRKKFKEYTLDRLSFSAGIGIYKEKYPISKIASEVGRLEEVAKIEDKNQVVLWTDEKLYQWETLENNILNEKITLIRNEFNNSLDHGKAFIYKLLELIREADYINIARLAYLLGRSKISEDVKEKLFEWAKDSESREELITAIEYYIYEVREED